MKGSGLVGDLEIAIELLELTLQSGQVARHCRGIANIVLGTEKSIKGCLDERRFCGAWTFGRFRQPRGHAFGEIDANSGLHRDTRKRNRSDDFAGERLVYSWANRVGCRSSPEFRLTWPGEPSRQVFRCKPTSEGAEVGRN